MVEKTLLQMYRGGMFDHIGGGFSRYSTDPYFLVPHFEKMLYDNALLILAYCKAYQLTQNQIYCDIAERTAAYVLRELTSPDGGFYCAQDADSEGVEGKYYLLDPSEVIEVLGEETGNKFNQYFDITRRGNFEGKNIPNLLKNTDRNGDMDIFLPAIYEYRKKRYALHLDDKILCSWNGLMITAMCHLYRVTENKAYLGAAVEAMDFIMRSLCENDTLYVSYREGKHSSKGFLDDYANVIFALLALYEARQYPAGYAMFLIALSDFDELSEKVIIVVKKGEQVPGNVSCMISLNAVCIVEEPSEKYKLKNDKMTFYVCRGHQCLPPVNSLEDVAGVS